MSDTSEVLPRDEALRLSCAFIEDPTKRAHILAIHAFSELLRDVPARVSEPLLGDIRYSWWSEAFEEIRDGRPVRYHPLSEAFKTIIAAYGLEPDAFIAAIDAHRPLLDGALPMKEALNVADAGTGALMALAAQILAPDADLNPLKAPVRFYALAGMRAARYLKADEAGEAERVHLWREAKAAMTAVPQTLLPLALPAALANDLWASRPRGPLAMRLKLLWTVATGRI